jgi:hypothetical protein
VKVSAVIAWHECIYTANGTGGIIDIDPVRTVMGVKVLAAVLEVR